MLFKIIDKKLKEPSLPYFYISRESIFSALDNEFNKNKKFIYLKGFLAYGKSICISGYLNEKFKDSDSKKYLWYSLDQWDKDPVTFTNYLYHCFKKNFDITDLSEYFSQPFKSESILKSFIGEFCNNLEEKLTEETYLVLDNFQEISNEENILKIVTYLFNYCPDKLKIIILSTVNMPEILNEYYLKNELYEFDYNLLFLNKNEADRLFDKLKITNNKLTDDLLSISNKSISLFTLLAQNAISTQDFTEIYESKNDNLLQDIVQNNRIYKNAIKNIVMQIYNNFSDIIKDFIIKTILLPKLDLNIISKIIKDKRVDFIIKSLKDHNVIYQSEENFYYNPVFISPLEEIIFSNIQKEEIIDNIISLSDNLESIMEILLKNKSFERILDLLALNYEYYFRNYLYETLLKIIEQLKLHFHDNNLIVYLDTRLKRTTGNITQAMENLKNIKNKTPLLLLEQGICHAALGNFKQAIEELSNLELNNDFELKDKITLINCLGISYMHNHDLNTALKYFNEIINLQDKLIYKHDVIKVYHNLGLAYTWLGEFSKAIESYEQSLYMSKQLKVLPLAMTYNNLSIIYNLQGDFQKSYQKCLEGLEIDRITRNPIDRIHLYLSLAESYRGIKNTYKEEECISILEDLLSKTPNTILDALLIKQKAYYSLGKGDFEKSRDYIYQAIHIRRLSQGDPSFLEYQLELAIIEFYDSKYYQVIKILSNIEDQIKDGNHKYHLARVYVYKALSFLNTDNTKEYKDYKNLAETMINKYNYLLLKEKLDLKNEKTDSENIIQFKIESFGEINISLANKIVNKKDWSGKKTKLLLLYLLLNKSGATKEQILNNLFPEGDRSRSALHILFNRLRKAIGVLFEEENINVIQYSEDLYKFNFSIDYWWDAERFEHLIKLYSQEKKISLLEDALKLYKGNFMSGLELENWVISSQSYYQNLAYSAYEKLSDEYIKCNQFEDLLFISDNLLKIDTCFEKACENKMRALVALNRKKDALKQYETFAYYLEKSLNEKPSKQIELIRNGILNI